MREWAFAGGLCLVEGAGGDAGGDEAQDQSGELVWDVELAGVAAVGQDHVGAEDRDGQAAQVMGFAQQYLSGPLAVAVAVRVQLVHGTHRADEPDIGLFVECRRIDVCRDRDRGQVGDRLDLGGDGQLDDLGGADDIRSEQLVVGQYVVDQGGGVHDDVDGVGQALPGVGIQAKVGVADIAGQYFEVLVGQRPEMRQ
ncbi:Uncharacterised protein [Mycobacteroides abscessus subsp. massiliense]|nr:Uncharacterised protein [Mycobacteroides abscessus subsp. massiliense]